MPVNLQFTGVAPYRTKTVLDLLLTKEPMECMGYSPVSRELTIQQLQQGLLQFSKKVQVVLATTETTGLILPTENSRYAHVYLFNVDAEQILAVEDAAYEIWGQNQPDDSRSVCFFIYTPAETREKFAQYAITTEHII